MNRKARRQMRKNARDVAARLARVAYDYTPQGQLVRVAEPEAVKALTRAFELVLQNGGESQVVRISEATANAFPRGNQGQKIGHPYLAVGLDADRRGTYSLRRVTTPGVPPQEADIMNRHAALSCLKPILESRGFPIGSPLGSA